MYEMKEALEAVSNINELTSEALYHGKELHEFDEMTETESMMELEFESNGVEFNIIYLGWTIFSSQDDDREWTEDGEGRDISLEDHLLLKVKSVNAMLLDHLKKVQQNLSSSCSNGREVCVYDHCEGLVKDAGCPHATKLIEDGKERMDCPYWNNKGLKKVIL